MGQIVGLNAKCKRTNLNAIGSVPTPANGELILVSTDNSMTSDGQGNFDRYIKGDGTTAAAALELKRLDKWVISEGSINYVEGHYYNSNGAVRDSVNYGYTEEYIPISPNTAYSFNPGATCSAYIVQYTSEKEIGTKLLLNAVPKNFTSAADAYYLRVSFLLAQVENVWLKDAFGDIIWQPVTPENVADATTFNSRITQLEEELGESEVETKVITTYTPSCLIMADSTNADFGNVVSYNNADYAVSPFIDIAGYNKLSVTTLTSTAQAGAGTVLYNANKEPLVGYYKAVAPSIFTVSAIIPEEAAYIRITNWSGSFSTGSVRLRLWDTLKEFTVRKTAELDGRINALESSGGIPSGLTQYEYVGEKISLIPKFAISAYMSFSLTGTGQGGANFGDYYFVGVGGNSVLNVFNLSTKTKIGTISLEAVDITNCHGNTLTFSNQYHTDGDEFPILYICSGYALNSNTKMYGYRIVNNNDVWSATLVHTITLANSTWTDAVIDNIRQKLWIKDVTTWYCVDMPQYANGDATIDLSEATPEFSYSSYEGSAQGHFFYNDKIYFGSGIPGSENVSRLYVLNTSTGKCDSDINLLPILGTSHEPENVFVYNGHLFVASRHNAFRMYFE